MLVDKKKKLKFLLPIFAIFGIFLIAGFALAQADVGLEFGAGIGLGEEDIRVTIARIIRTALGFLGIVAVVVVIAGGVVWLTAGGDAKRIDIAKKIMVNGAIGLAIILSAFAIAQFVLNKLIESTTRVPSGIIEPGVGPGGGFGPTAFILRGITPSGAIPIRNVTARATFNAGVDGETVGGNFIVTRAVDGSVVEGTLVTARNTIEFTPTANCPEPNEDRKCFAADTEYRVRLTGDIRSQAGRELICGGFAPACEGVFITGSLIDVEGPEVEVTAPDSGESVSVDALVNLEALAVDDAGVSQLEFYVDEGFIDADAPLGETPLEYIGEVVWDTTGVILGRHSVTARAYDIDTNDTMSRAINIYVRAAHCFNGLRDADEGGIDCGGEDCAVCDGGPCVEDGDCSSGVCRDGVCVAVPRIDGVDPGNGREGNYISILGEFFGDAEGQVIFLGDEEDMGDNQVAPLADCATAWQNDQVIVEVPVGAASGPIQLIAANNEIDTTNNERGALIDDFNLNEILRPGICEVRPSSGVIGDALDIKGAQFGEAEGVNQALLAGRSILPTSWTNELISGTIPNVAQGRQPVQVIVGGEASNPVNFRIVSREAGTIPSITYIDPASGPRENYITIYGENFGRSMGTVIFRNSATGDDATALVNFPAACGDDFWHNDSTTVKVPVEYVGEIDVMDGLHLVRVRRADGVESAGVEFSIEEGAAGPGICRINPDNGPSGRTTVTVSGERFSREAGGLRFWEEKAAAISSWEDQQILSMVPPAAITGPVRAIVGEQQSNSVNFTVSDCNESGCGEGEECCETGVCIPEDEECVGGPRSGGFAWRFSTGVIPTVPRVVEECREGASPSPSPWDARRGGNDVCINAVINVRFTMEMDEETLNEDNIGVYQCVAEGDENSCLEMMPIRGRIEIFEDGFQFLPFGGLEISSIYYVNLTIGIRGAGAYGDFMAEKADRCGIGNAYCFSFGTRADDNPCAVGSVVVDPANTTIIKQGGTKNYMSSAISRGDICIALNPDAYDWNWYVREEDGGLTADADITNVDSVGGGADGLSSDGNIDASQTATGNYETVPDPPVNIWVEIADEDVRDDGQLIINFTDPEILSRWPDCSSACINSEIGAQFNTSINVSTLRLPGNFIVYECANESCRRFNREVGGRVEYSEEEKVAVFEHSGLEESEYYRVIIRGGTSGVKSDSGALLTRTNYGENERDYSWTFRTRDSDLPCEISNVEVKPKNKVLNYIGETQFYSAASLGAPDECSERGQRLQSINYNWSWGSSELAVADFVRTRGGLLDVLPREGVGGCANQCLRTGTPSGISVCGNRRTELGEDCDDGNIMADDGCSSICLNEGSGAGRSTCGNGRVELGEDCDDGNTDVGDGCDSDCLNEGSAFGGSVCGSGDVGDGEDCDDGNSRDNDGCSRECLNEGSLTGPIPICGNRRLENGEDCDDGNTNVGDGCGAICLNEGSNRCDPSEEFPTNCCGNNIIENGEDCDYGDTDSGDGCSSRCLYEGSDLAYGSICGNAVTEDDLETGEECEFADGGDGRIDPFQYAEAIFGGETIISARADEVSGEGTLRVACVCERDSQCVGERFPDGLGCGADGCCVDRPQIEFASPRGRNICRNPLISVYFDQLMDAGSFSEKFRVDEKSIGGDCPNGGSINSAGTWCIGAFSGNISSVDIEGRTKLMFAPDRVLGPEKRYRVVVYGDSNLLDDVSKGVLNTSGVAMDGNYVWTFLTGNEICTLDDIELTPDPLYFLEVGDRTIMVHAYTRIGAERQEIAPISGVYDWSWDWEVRDTELVSVTNTDLEIQTVSLSPDSPQKGETTIIAVAEIVTDTISLISTKGRKVSGDGEVIVLICNNPWPARGVDGSWSPYHEESTNFRFYYCRDAGLKKACVGGVIDGIACDNNEDCGDGVCRLYFDDDLPSIFEPVEVPAPPLDDIITEFIVPVECSADSATCGRGDAMGIRVMKNLDHHAPIKWHGTHGFTGNPTEVFVDGYPSLQDGRSIYVNAVNQPLGSENLYTNIYIISYTQDAGIDTMEIYRQILENITFTTTIEDWNDKDSLRRDVVRLADVREMEEALANYGRLQRYCSVSQGMACLKNDDCPGDETCSYIYPKLESGSFLQYFTNSKWPSWQVALGSELGYGMPQDPLNQFGECPEGYNPETCYNTNERTYICPSNSHIYSYQNCLGNNFNLSFNLEYTGGNWTINKLFDLTYNLTMTDCEGEIWNSANICTEERGEPGVVSAAPPGCGNGILEVVGVCLEYYEGDCIAYEEGEVCDDGSLNGDYNHCNINCSDWGAYCGDGYTQVPPYGVEVCDLGTSEAGSINLNGLYNSYCSWDCRSPRGPYCGDREINGNEDCEIGDYEINTEDCEGILIDGYPTKKVRNCAENCSWEANWSSISCMQAGSCGNGLKDSEIEECDDGNSNNSDSCANNCKIAFCGDGYVRINYEQCDLGELNGVRCAPGRGLMCTYCSERCTLLTISGD